jgi:adenylate kinase family enzyme
MKSLEFPIIGTKKKGVTKKFDLNNPSLRNEYFEAKAGEEIKLLKNYLKKNSFIAFLLGKKNSGKGTYSVLFSEIFGNDHVAHVSVGDIVRDVHENWNKFVKSKDYRELKKLYRGYISFDDAVDALLGRSTEKLLPTEFILALLKLHISKLGKKAIFIDGLPRESDQVSYSLYFRDLINFRDDPDIFILIDIPETVIDERIKYRVVCPLCHSSRNLKLLPTSKIEYDEKKKEFYLICDNPNCEGARMEAKEGDNLGIDPIRPRLEKDETILRSVFSLHGIPKILLRNHVPVKEADKYFDKYEITPEYVFKLEGKKVKVEEKPWSVKDDNKIESNSLLAAPVVVSMLKQLVEVLDL